MKQSDEREAPPWTFKLTETQDQARVVELYKLAGEMIQENNLTGAEKLIGRGLEVAARAFRQNRRENAWLVSWMLALLCRYYNVCGERKLALETMGVEAKWHEAMTVDEKTIDDLETRVQRLLSN